MIGAAVWLDPPSGGILGDLSYPSPLFDCRTLVPMLHTIKAFTDRDRDGAGDAFVRRAHVSSVHWDSFVPSILL